MKKMTKLLAGILVIAMAASVLCVPAFAENENPLAKYGEGTGYVAFGDSITRGYGASEKWDDEGYNMDGTDNPQCRNVTGAYPKIIADAIGCNTDNNILNKEATYWPIAQDAMTASFLVDLLGIEDDYYDAEYTHGNSQSVKRYNTDLYYFGVEESMTNDGLGRYGKTGVSLNIRDMISNASLITSAIGMGEVLCRAQALALQDNSMDDVAKLVEALIYRLYEGYDSWLREYPKVLQYFKDSVREDCTVVLVGAINPLYNMSITSEDFVPVGNAVSVISGLMNQQTKQWADEYGFMFVDISNVETGSTTNDISFVEFLSLPVREQGLATHPTPDGYAQIARMILAALEQKDAEEQEAKTTIRVDLGRLADVDYVMLDGKKITNYTVENSVLTIKAGTPYAKSLTVASHEGAKVAISVYSLSYDNGYSAYRLYTSNDVLTATTTTVKTASIAIKGVLGKLFGK